jgi:hypothetical protein
MRMIWCFRGCEDSYSSLNTEYGGNIFLRNVHAAYQTTRHRDSKHHIIKKIYIYIYIYCSSIQITYVYAEKKTKK